MKKRPKIDVGAYAHILSWSPKDKKADEASVDPPEKNTEVPSTTPVAEIQPEKEIKTTLVQPVKSVKVAPPEENSAAKVSVLKNKSPAPEHKFSPEVQKSVGMALGSRVVKNTSTARALDHNRSPKRQQLDPSVAVDMSSPSSVSSSSSPPVAAMTSSMSRDALESLTSRVVVRTAGYASPRQQ